MKIKFFMDNIQICLTIGQIGPHLPLLKSSIDSSSDTCWSPMFSKLFFYAEVKVCKTHPELHQDTFPGYHLAQTLIKNQQNQLRKLLQNLRINLYINYVPNLGSWGIQPHCCQVNRSKLTKCVSQNLQSLTYPKITPNYFQHHSQNNTFIMTQRLEKRILTAIDSF